MTNEQSDDVYVIDATTDKVLTTIPVEGKRPRGVVVSPDGKKVYTAPAARAAVTEKARTMGI